MWWLLLAATFAAMPSNWFTRTLITASIVCVGPDPYGNGGRLSYQGLSWAMACYLGVRTLVQQIAECSG